VGKHSRNPIDEFAGAGRARAVAAKPKLRASLLAGATVGVAASVVGVPATQPESVSASQVDLAALIVVGSSTHPDGSGNENFYGGLFNPPGTDLQHVNFFLGPLGIDQALRDHPNDPNVVLSSGWGAANASLLATAHDPAITDDDLVILDNNVARPNGGFGTRYPIFALIGVNPIPSPTDTDAHILDVGYEYDINGNAPAYPLDLASDANSLAAYLYRRLNQQDVDLPVNPNGEPVDEHGNVISCPDTCTVESDSGTAYIKTVGNTTYITFKSDDLPLTRPLRDSGALGASIADAVDPTLRTIVDYGYPNNDPIADPDVYTPAGIVPGPKQTIQAAQRLSTALHGTLDDNAAQSSVVTSHKPAVKLSPNFTPKRLGGDGSTAGTPRPTPIKDAVNNLSRAVTKALGVGRKHTADSD
jgi:hypothetical protein